MHRKLDAEAGGVEHGPVMVVSLALVGLLGALDGGAPFAPTRAPEPAGTGRLLAPADAGPLPVPPRPSTPLDAGARDAGGLDADAGVPPPRTDGYTLPDGGVVITVRAPDGGLPPRGLACLPNWYAGTVTWRADGGWGLALTSDVFLQWDNGAEVGDSESEDANPDLEDVFHTPYVTGPIVPVDASDAGIKIREPGRVRIEQLFLLTYGASMEAVQDHLAKVRFAGTRYPFHEKAAPALARVNDRLMLATKENPKLLPFLTDIGGTWMWRRIMRSKNLSTHAWGIAIDLNADRGAYWRWTRRGEPIRWQNKVPQEVVDAFEAEGFIWGGRWVHYDTMHFEFRPELISPLCR